MPLSRENLNRQGLDAKSHRRDPRWRQLNAKCRQLRRRLKAVQAIEDRDAEVARRKTEAHADAE